MMVWQLVFFLFMPQAMYLFNSPVPLCQKLRYGIGILSSFYFCEMPLSYGHELWLTWLPAAAIQWGKHGYTALTVLGHDSNGESCPRTINAVLPCLIQSQIQGFLRQSS